MEENQELTLEDLRGISSGVDYSPAYPTFDAIRAWYKRLISMGVPEDQARQQTKNEFNGQVLSICNQFPDNCSPAEQAAVIFSMLIGS